jgi:hypothetical protein
MPSNRLIYLGILVVAASGLIWLGAILAKLVEWIVPYSLGIGVLAIVAGLVLESRKKRQAHEASSGS